MPTLITGGNGDMARAIAEVLEGKILTPDRSDLDVTHPLQVREYIEKYKPACVINAAGYISPDKVISSDIDEWVDQIEVNLIGTYFISREALRNGAQTIINIASTSGMRGRADWSAYCASKAGVISLTQSLAVEGVNAYCISPHRTATKMRKELFGRENKKTLLAPKKIAEVVKDILADKYPSGSNIEVGTNGIKVHD